MTNASPRRATQNRTDRSATAYVGQADFAYDADTQTASFFTPYKDASAPQPDTTHKFENVTFDDPHSNKNSAGLIAKIPLARAKELPHADLDRGLRVARIFTLNGQKAPAVDGWFMKPGPFENLNPTNDEDFRRSSEQIDRQQFTIHARLISVRVFDPEYGSVQHPLYAWDSGSDRC